MSKFLDELNAVTLREIYPRIIKDEFERLLYRPSDPTPVRVPMPPFTYKPADISTVLQMEMLPAYVRDNGLNQHFSDWSISPFSTTSQVMTAQIRAQRICDGRWFQKSIAISPDIIDAAVRPEQVFSQIDALIETALKDFEDQIIVPHVPGQLCNSNPFCSECYE